MALKDLMKSLGGVFSRVSADITRRPDGGTSHYRPLRKKTAEYQPGEAAQAQAPGPDLRYAHTGFTGMNPPADYGAMGQGTGYGGGAFGQTAYGQPAYGQTAYVQQTGSQGTYFRGQEADPRQDYVGKGSFSGQTGFTQARRNNISYMPGMEPRAERGQVHVEHIITLTGLKSCYEAIECMKDGETLIVMLDAIANESESMRCQDMLAGAAFTLGWSVRLLQGGRIVVIAPEGVKILPEQAAVNDMMRPPEMMAARAPAAAEAPHPVRRERRTGANAAEWNAARNGELEGYNPYTGTMPVAAGSYGSFGGYGY